MATFRGCMLLLTLYMYFVLITGRRKIGSSKQRPILRRSIRRQVGYGRQRYALRRTIRRQLSDDRPSYVMRETYRYQLPSDRRLAWTHYVFIRFKLEMSGSMFKGTMIELLRLVLQGAGDDDVPFLEGRNYSTQNITRIAFEKTPECAIELFVNGNPMFNGRDNNIPCLGISDTYQKYLLVSGLFNRYGVPEKEYITASYRDFGSNKDGTMDVINDLNRKLLPGDVIILVMNAKKNTKAGISLRKRDHTKFIFNFEVRYSQKALLFSRFNGEEWIDEKIIEDGWNLDLNCLVEVQLHFTASFAKATTYGGCSDDKSDKQEFYYLVSEGYIFPGDAEEYYFEAKGGENNFDLKQIILPAMKPFFGVSFKTAFMGLCSFLFFIFMWLYLEQEHAFVWALVPAKHFNTSFLFNAVQTLPQENCVGSCAKNDEGEELIDRSVPLIFVGGMPRSGTTLMRVMLDAHKDIRCGGETKVITRMLGLREGWVDMNPGVGMGSFLAEGGVTKSVVDSAVSAFILQIIKKHGKSAPVLCNKDPFTLGSGVTLSQMFPNSKFILMLRDGRAVVHSLIKRKVTIDSFDLTDYRQCLQSWSASMQRLYNQCYLLGEHLCFPMYYEQLILHPEEQTRALFSFLGLPWNESVIHHHEHIGEEVSVSNLEPSTDQVVKPIYLKALTEWVGRFPPDVVEEMPQIAPMLAKLGYDPFMNPPNYGKPDEPVVQSSNEAEIPNDRWVKLVKGPKSNLTQNLVPIFG